MAAQSRGRQLRVGKVDPKVVLVVLACLAASVATYLLYTGPSREEAQEARSQATQAASELSRKQARIEAITSGRKSGAAELLQQARNLDAALPDDVDKVALVAAVPDLAADAGVVVNQMDPVATPASVKNPTGKMQSFTVSATGSLSSLTTWVDALQAYPATLTVSGLQVTTSAGADATATFTLNAHYVSSAELTARD